MYIILHCNDLFIVDTSVKLIKCRLIIYYNTRNLYDTNITTILYCYIKSTENNNYSSYNYYYLYIII